ncbi:MAG: GNAT family N-acetyltransferase [Phycisphaerales bacterium]
MHLPPLIQTARLTLRPIAAGDRAEFLRVHLTSWATHLGPWSPLPPVQADGTPDFEAMFAQALVRSADGFASGTACRLLAFDAAGALVGGFNLNNIIRGIFQNADAGWWVAADQTRKGYATEGVAALVRHALALPPAGLGLHRVQCGIIPRNAASLAVAARVGLRREGLAERYLKINGVWEDHVIFAITAEDLSV